MEISNQSMLGAYHTPLLLKISLWRPTEDLITKGIAWCLEIQGYGAASGQYDSGGTSS
jgi:hypothetical protein